ncbi:MAG: hypothetical protein E6R03_14240 [Hyphomicrobiaceae bacterium]|nr:MAG: hypothetical protein E6R03_14240 [Hyphomicrobiaceae bacterium]
MREEVVFLRKKLRVEETPTERRQRLEPRAINLLSELMVNELPLTKRAIAREIGVPESTLRQWTGPNSFNERFGKAIASLKAQLADKVSQSVAEDEFWE